LLPTAKYIAIAATAVVGLLAHATKVILNV